LKKILNLKLPNGVEPFEKWMEELDPRTQARIYTSIDRVAAGGSRKNIKALGDGIFEIKVNCGPGYRVYFCEIEKVIILLLLGGDKSTQERDIEKAKDYWRKYVQK
jgi:putative addiction module killer protein